MTTAKRTRFLPVYLPEGTGLYFPNPRNESGFDGLVAVGGDLGIARMLHAYRNGIFPWYSEGMEILWWSPDPRAIIETADIHRSRSLMRRLRRGNFDFSVDRAFTEVLEGCADRSEGTWLLPEMVDAYTELHRLGHAHSFEVWQGSKLVGGLYGVHLGGLFAAESMFHRATDASKAVLVVAVTSLGSMGVELFDVQFETAHLASMGAKEITRVEYLDRLELAVKREVTLDGMRLRWESC